MDIYLILMLSGGLSVTPANRDADTEAPDTRRHILWREKSDRIKAHEGKISQPKFLLEPNFPLNFKCLKELPYELSE